MVLSKRVHVVRLRVKLWQLLVLAALVALAFTYVCWRRHELAQRRREMAAIENMMMAMVRYDYQMTHSPVPGPSWARKLLGEDAFAEPVIECMETRGNLARLKEYRRVKRLRLLPGAVTDFASEIPHLADLQHLTRLRLAGGRYGDRTLFYAAQLTRLEVLDVTDTTVSDRGLREISGLPSLRVLRVGLSTGEDMDTPTREDPRPARSGPLITDAAVDYVVKLRGIEELCIASRGITDKGVAALRILPRLKSLDLTMTAITDASLEEIKTFHCLKSINLAETAVSPGAMTAFRESRPGVEVNRGSIWNRRARFD